MSLVATYASEVGRRLPRKNRSDIEAEICSALQDLLEERNHKTGKPVDDEMIFEVLKEYGEPEKVASSYQEDRYLIGPRLYPIFLRVFRILFPAIAILAGIGSLVNVSQNVTSVINAAGTYVPIDYVKNSSGIFVSVFIGVVTTVMFALGNLVLIFAIIEWVMRNEGISSRGKIRPTRKEWDPHSLTRISPPNQVKLVDTIMEIVGCFAAILIFNFYPQIFSLGLSSGGLWYIGAGNWTSIPLLSREFLYFIPYLTLVWSLTIILDIILLRKGFWNITARIVSIGLKVIGILIAACMLFQPNLIALSTASLSTAGFPMSPDTIVVMIFSLDQLVRLVLILAIFLSGLDIVRSLLSILRPPSPIMVNEK